MTEALLVIHDAGDPQAGGRWADMVGAWPGPALAPDLPGHGSASPPVGASYAPGDAALASHRALEEESMTGGDLVILGHGWGAFAAELLAAAGRASSLVIVDGLGPPWCSAAQLVEDQQRWLRQVFSDPAALAPPRGSPDPRLAHGFPSIWDRGFIAGLRATVDVPVLAIETPASRTPPAERDHRIGDFAGPAALLDASDAAATEVALAMREAGWLP